MFIPKKHFFGGEIRKCRCLVMIGIYLIFFISFYKVYAAKILFINNPSKQSISLKQLEIVSYFYGLDVEMIPTEFIKSPLNFSEFLDGKCVQAIVISAESLQNIDREVFLAAIEKRNNVYLPILIMDVTPDTKISVLKSWSERTVRNCIGSGAISSQRFYKVTNLKKIAHQLASQEIGLTNKGNVYYFRLSKDQRLESILEVASKDKKNLFPVFVKFAINKGRETFFLTRMQLSNSRENEVHQYNNKRFIELMPLFMFLKYSFGEYCWHSSMHYANLIIDDPWLIEPYGFLSYKGLLKEMKNYNFHTSIALIPWNYDRSKKNTITLFKNNPDRFSICIHGNNHDHYEYRFSICIHGNNHDHYEFYKYKTKPKDPWSAKPLNVQEANIKQALARMEKFRNLTGLSYDKVMVFPHGIAPAKTLGLLKKYNFLVTVNANNVPLGSSKPSDILFPLRNVTLRYENFPSLRRYPINRSMSDIAIDLFLDNPLIFWTHHDFFQKGIDAFDKTARMVNEIEPDIIWQGLGYIAQRLYLEKLRDDGNYDLLAFSSNFIIKNTHQHDLTYFVRKEEDFSIPIKKVTVDGQLYSYKKSGNNILLKVFIPSEESRHIVIEYENDLDISAIDISKNDPRINRLRKLSDFRDMTLS
ncbi:MAG: hypothetical protein ACTSO2_14940, partial [Promethearchaeota archaeon]